MVDRWAAYGARAAIASGVLAAIAAVVLVLFFLIEAPALIASGSSDTWTPLGRTNDALIGLAALVAIPLALRLHQSWHAWAPGPSNAALAVGLVSMVVAGVIQLAYAANLTTTPTQAAINGPAFAGFGVWLLAVNLAPADPTLTGRLRWVGAVGGIGYVLILVTILAVGGAGNLADPQTALGNPIVVALFAISIPASMIGYPIWAIWLGRRLRIGGGPGG